MSNPERLFRDAEGAALERAAHLEDENRELREEIERLTAEREAARAGPDPAHRAPPGPPPPVHGRVFVAALALPLCLIALLVAVGPHHRTRACPSSRSVPMSLHAVGPTVHEVTPVGTSTACDPPFHVDARGHRHYRVECLR